VGGGKSQKMKEVEEKKITLNSIDKVRRGKRLSGKEGA